MTSAGMSVTAGDDASNSKSNDRNNNAATLGSVGVSSLLSIESLQRRDSQSIVFSVKQKVFLFSHDQCLLLVLYEVLSVSSISCDNT